MEYGYEITDTAGNKRFFVEGCSYCAMSTGGHHQVQCPLYFDSNLQTQESMRAGTYRVIDGQLLYIDKGSPPLIKVTKD